MPEGVASRYEFGPFAIDSANRLLTRNGEVIPLTPKAADLLLVLVAAPSQVVTKDALMRAVWPDSFVEEGSLAQNIFQIRKALGGDRTYIETVPKRGYRFVAEVRGSHESFSAAVSTPLPASPPRSRRAWLLGTALVLAGVAVILSRGGDGVRGDGDAAPRFVPFTSFPGGEYEPAFSPDGGQIAFVWSGELDDNYDIYVKRIGDGALVRLTSDPAAEGSPAWSPDGRSIAFVRYGASPERSGIYIVPAAGGAERKLASVQPLSHIFDSHLDWSPDGNTLTVVDKARADGPFTIFLVSAVSGAKRKLTDPPANSMGDTGPRFSPDGKSIAFRRNTGSSVNDLFVIGVSGAGLVRVTSMNGFISSHAWLRNGRELMYASSNNPQGFWRVAASGGAPRPIHSLTPAAGANFIAVSPQGNRLAYSQWFADGNVWRVPIGAAGVTAKALIRSTRDERSAQYSPDGNRIAFRSDRSGATEIYVCDAEGANPVQLTSFGGPLTGTPRWSPDGKQIVFDSRPDGNSDIYSVDVGSHAVRRLTRHEAADAVPSWSWDGRWIYFASNRSGQWQVWKVAADSTSDSAAIQVTRQGGFAPLESRDGRTLYYAKGVDASGLWQIPVGGGGEMPVIPRLKAGNWGYWAPGGRGIYFVDVDGSGVGIYLYAFDTGDIAKVAGLAQQPPFADSGFSVSPDGQRIIYTQVDHSGSDITLVEDFR